MKPYLRILAILVMLLLVTIVLAGCVRPTPENLLEDDVTATAVTDVDLSDPNVGGGVIGDTPASVSPVPATAVGEATPIAPTATPIPPTVAPPTETTTEAVAPTPVPAQATPISEVTATAQPVSPPSPATATPTTAVAATGERTHVVQPGENLFRIGLQYGISWVALAQYNNLTDPNDVRAGEVLRIPPSGVPLPTPTAPPTGGITFYVVQPGDNLYRIGQKFGVSWVQIAEANGLVNPNQIIVGQTLKIPVNAPGPTPQFTHVVKAGETIYRIAVQYGVPWLAIAQANNIQSPYVIYAGQTLIIPGG
jgi:LysM repeat protein